MAKVLNVLTNVTGLGTSLPALILHGNYLAAGTARTLTAADNGATILLDTVTGSTVTLPAATGNGTTYKFVVSVLATSNSHKIQVANALDFFVGVITSTLSGTPTTNNGWIAANSGTVATNSDTVTLNRTTTGSVTVGETIEVTDIGSTSTTGTWLITGRTTQSGAGATPFTAAV